MKCSQETLYTAPVYKEKDVHSFSSNAIFHACDDNLKMRQNLPTETLKIGATEVFGQVQQTYSGKLFSISHHSHVHFPQQALRSLVATREIADSCGDRISSLTNTKIFISCYKLARFIFLRSWLKRLNANNEPLRTKVRKLRPAWKKNYQNNIPPTPHIHRKFLGLWHPHPPGISIPFSGGYGYFLEPHNAVKNTLSSSNFSHVSMHWILYIVLTIFIPFQWK